MYKIKERVIKDHNDIQEIERFFDNACNRIISQVNKLNRKLKTTKGTSSIFYNIKQFTNDITFFKDNDITYKTEFLTVPRNIDEYNEAMLVQTEIFYVLNLVKWDKWKEIKALQQ